MGIAYNLRCKISILPNAILTSIYPCFQRHILTAAHCVCGKRDVHGSDATLCIDRDVSQIQNDPSNNRLNILTIYGGRKNQSDANWNNRGELGHYRWQVSHAYIMQKKLWRLCFKIKY